MFRLRQVALVAHDLDAVVDTVSSLEGGDPTIRTKIVRAVADVTGATNRVQAALDSKRRNLGSEEAAAAFDAELALVEQTLNGSVSGASTPEDCDSVLARLLVTIERLESRYGQEPERSARIAELRSNAHEITGERRTTLLDERNRRASRIVEAADRLLATVTRRASEFANDKEEAQDLFTDAIALEEAGCFAIVCEMIREEVATELTRHLEIPTIGIGSGSGCDGQILVTTDVLGLTPGNVPSFVKPYAQLATEAGKALGRFVNDVREGRYPKA